MPTVRVFLLGAFALMLAPLVTAQTVETILHASAVSWETEESRVAGTPIGLAIRRWRDGDGMQPSNHGFQLTGRFLHAEWDESGSYLVNPVMAGSATPPTRGSADYSDVVLVGKASRDERSLHLFPFEGATLTVSMHCGMATESKHDVLAAQSRVDLQRPEPSRDTSSALQLEPCTDSEFSVSGGPFLVVMWEWDAELVANEGRDVLWSGMATNEAAPVDTRPYQGRARQLYLTVSEGVFTMNTEANWSPRLFMQDAGLSNAAQVTLTNVRGTFASIQDPAEIRLNGNVGLRLLPADQELRAEILAGAHQASVNGASVPLTTTPPSAPVSRFWLGAGLLAMVGAVLATVPRIVHVRRRRFEAHFDQYLDQAYELQNRLMYRKGLRLTARLLEHEATNPHVHYLHGYALLRLERPVAALGHLERGRELALKQGEDGPFCAFVCMAAAQAAALQVPRKPELRQVVVEYLRQAIKNDPDSIEGMSLQVELLPFLREAAIVRALPAGKDGSDLLKP